MAESQIPEQLEAARRAAYPHALTELSSTLLLEADTSSLGCKLLAGLPLPDPVEVHRLEFLVDGAAYAVHVSADGSMTQVCDERYPNLGAGAMPVERIGVESDGDGLADSADQCPQIAGLAGAENPGCPQASSADRDGDGSEDHLDLCPDQAGAWALDGCAILTDEDGDGVPDHIDICPADFGVYRSDFAIGCPADGSGASNQRRASDEICLAIGADMPVFAGRTDDSAVIDNLPFATVIGRTAAQDWYQVTEGWVRSEQVQLAGACYNISLVNPAPGGATGCFMRPSGDIVNVRVAPAGAQLTRLRAHEQQAVLGANFAGDWLFYRAGWVNRAVVELAGNCEGLPSLNPAQVASGVIQFCPPEYTGFLPPRIDIGEANARVASTSLANRLRAEPDYRAEKIGEIPPQSLIDAILDGPACQAPFVWWQVEVDGQVGWTVESDFNAYHYYLEPVQPTNSSADSLPSETAKPASNRLIHSANIGQLDTVSLLNLNSPQAIVWSPRQSWLAAITGSGELALFATDDYRPIALDPQSSAPPTAIAFSPDESWLAVGDRQGVVTLIGLSADSQPAAIVSLGQQAGAVSALAWTTADDKLAAVSGAEHLKLVRQAGTLKVWQFDPSAPSSSEVVLRHRYPYPLTAVAFSRDDRWLAVSGESTGSRRAALWVYHLETGELVFSKALVPMRGHGFVAASPADDLADFVYNSGDSLYQLDLGSGDDRRFYYQASAVTTGIAFRPQVIAGAELLMALTTETRSGQRQLQLANALNPHSLKTSMDIAASAIAFSPYGRLLAVTESDSDRIRVLGVSAQQ